MTKLDEILTAANASNHDLVEMLPSNLNHKMVQKARLGKKPVPRHTQDLIIEALNLFLQPEVKYRRQDVFNEQLTINNEQWTIDVLLLDFGVI